MFVRNTLSVIYRLPKGVIVDLLFDGAVFFRKHHGAKNRHNAECVKCQNIDNIGRNTLFQPFDENKGQRYSTGDYQDHHHPNGRKQQLLPNSLPIHTITSEALL